MIAKFARQPKWFVVKPARKSRNLGGLSSIVIVREDPSVSGFGFINFSPKSLLNNLGQHLPIGVGPAHPGYLSVNHILATGGYRVMFEYLEGYPQAQWLWTQQGHPDWLKSVKYKTVGE